jgi:hypothetical protein
MTIDWAAHYDPLYAAFGVSATLTLAETNVSYSGLTVIDKTAGVELTGGLPGTTSRGDVSMLTILPACAVRAAELVANGIALSALKGSLITFNGNVWRIENRRAAPSPAGELVGEIYLILIEHRDD